MNSKELRNLIKEMINEEEYKNLNSFVDQNLYESYSLLGELLNPDNSYEYYKEGKGIFIFEDNLGYEFFVRLVFQPIDKGYFEIKMGWLDLPNDQKYLQQSAREIDEKRSDTIAKIYRDEIIPLFLNQNNIDILKIKPLDIKRYQFSIRLIKKFTPNNIKIEENKPHEIILRK